MRFHHTVLCAVAVVLAIPVTSSAQKLLRWKFHPGQILEVELGQDVEMETDSPANDMRSSADMGMTLVWKVRDVDNQGNAQIEQSIDRIRMKMSMPGSAPLEFDSADKSLDDGMAKHLAESVHPLIGTRFSQQMTHRGELLDMKLTEEDAAALRAATPGPRIDETFSHEGLASLIRQAGLVLPREPVSAGDTWESRSKIDSPAGTLTMQTTYRYYGTELVDGRPLERIDLDITLGFGAGPNAMGLDVSVSDQENSGTMYFDAELGQFVRSEVAQNMTVETKLAQNVHRQQLNTTLRMTVNQPAQIASATSTVR